MIDAAIENLSFLALKFSRNKLSHTIEAADPALTNRVDLKYQLSLFVPEFPFSSNFDLLHTSDGREAPVSTEGGVQVFAGAEFRFNSGRNGKIDGLLSYSKPRWKQDRLSLSLTQTTSYFLREKITGGTPAVNISNDLAKTYAIKAGLSNEDFYAYSETFFKVWQAKNWQFLTWQPDFKTVGPVHEEYLYYLLNFSPIPTEIRLRVQYFYQDGSISEPMTKMTLSNPLTCSVVCCPVGMAALGVPAGVTRYEVWLSNETNKRFSQTRSYQVDRNYQIADRAIMFVNSLGGWDTLRLTGEGSRNLKVAQSVAEIERTASANTDFSELKIIAIDGEYEIQVNTGYFRKNASAYLKYLDELLLSDEMYLLTEKGHRPVQLTTNNLVDTADNSDLVARSFTFRILDTVENYSDLPASEPSQEKPTSWRGLNLQHVLDGYGKRTGKLAFQRLQKVYSEDNAPFKPNTIKPNVQGDPDYIAPILDSTIPVGSTPYPNVLISRLGSFKRSNCTPNELGTEATITIAAAKYGGETAGVADALAESEFASLNTQEYANSKGLCVLNNVPIHFGIRHYFPMDLNNKIIGSADYGPVVNLRISGEEIIPNCTGSNPMTTRLSEKTYDTGKYNFILQVLYQASPQRTCKIVLMNKNREIVVDGPNYYVFDNVTVNSADEPLIFEIKPI